MWRKLHVVLCLLMVLVTLLRLATGNIIGALIPLVLAVVFGAIAFDFPMIDRLRRVWRTARRLWGG